LDRWISSETPATNRSGKAGGMPIRARSCSTTTRCWTPRYCACLASDSLRRKTLSGGNYSIVAQPSSSCRNLYG
jgi:hypothetical protein